MELESYFHFLQIYRHSNLLSIHLSTHNGRYQKGNPINTPIETVDPSVDNNHCAITVSRDKHGRLRYVLRDTNSNTGTFVDNVEIPPRERRVIEDGTLFTIGATSIILRTPNKE